MVQGCIPYRRMQVFRKPGDGGQRVSFINVVVFQVLHIYSIGLL